jgi:serine/threonine protein kinase
MALRRNLPKLPELGDVIAGKYKLLRPIGEGGMGAVFAAQHIVLEQTVAVKLLFSEVLEKPGTAARFVKEAQAAARLRTDHVARVMDAGTTEDGMPFIVMELLEGSDMAEVLRIKGRLGVQEVADAMIQACEALAHAHVAGIVHRDIKPSNLFRAIQVDGSELLKIVDFGISKITSSEGAKVDTVTGKNLVGSPGYMSPEQIRSARSVDGRSDVWALGIVMYELLTGRLPFEGEGVGELLAAILEDNPRPLRAICDDVSPAFEQVVKRCLERNRAMRFQNVGELALALVPFASLGQVATAERAARIAGLSSGRLVAAVEQPPVVRQARSEGPGTPATLSIPSSAHVALSRPTGSRPKAGEIGALEGEIGQPLSTFHGLGPNGSRWLVGAAALLLMTAAFLNSSNGRNRVALPSPRALLAQGAVDPHLVEAPRVHEWSPDEEADARPKVIRRGPAAGPSGGRSLQNGQGRPKVLSSRD